METVLLQKTKASFFSSQTMNPCLKTRVRVSRCQDMLHHTALNHICKNTHIQMPCFTAYCEDVSRQFSIPVKDVAATVSWQWCVVHTYALDGRWGLVPLVSLLVSCVFDVRRRCNRKPSCFIPTIDTECNLLLMQALITFTIYHTARHSWRTFL